MSKTKPKNGTAKKVTSPSAAKPVSKGKAYEAAVASVYKHFSSSATVKEDQTIIGKSGEKRQIDVEIRTAIIGNPILVIIECKKYGRPVEIGEVDEFIGKIGDVDAHKGVLVSDSGFTAGAVSRAKQDHRVQLAAVIDSSVASLRTKLHVPMRVTFHNIPTFTVNLAVTKLVTDQSESPELSESDKQHVKRLLHERGPKVFHAFKDWTWSKAGWDLPPGTHSQNTEIGEPHIRVTVTFTFDKSIRSFVNDNIFAEAIGIYDHVQKQLVQAHVNGTTLEETQIIAGWREVLFDAPEEHGVDNYGRLATPSAKMVEDTLHDLLDGVAKRWG